MFRFLVGFTYVLYIFIRSSKCSSVLASFNESCSETRLCQSPLICSNTSRCLCSKSSSTWNEDLKDCFYCPQGWTAWENNNCLSFAVPSTGGLSYEQANGTCQSFSAELFSINNILELQQFNFQVNRLLRETFSSAVSLYFRLGAWINRLNINTDDDVWCADHEIDPLLDCVYIRRDRLKNNSLCLSRLICEEEIPFICHMMAISERYTINNDKSDSSNHRFIQMLAEFAPLALNILGNLFNQNQQGQQTTQAPPPPPPQQIIIQRDPMPAAQAGSSDKTMLLIGYFLGGFILLIILCGCAGAIIYFFVYAKNPESLRQNNQRASVESTSSNA